MSYAKRVWNARLRLVAATICVALGVVACGGDDSPPMPPQQAQSFAVAKATCGTGDTQETGLQGQVPLSAQVGGFKGFNCNLKPVSTTPSARGQGAFGMFAMMHDKSGHTCGYTGSAFLDAFGLSVVDLTDPENAVETAVITTPGVTNPGEGLRVNEARGLLIGSYYNNAPSTADANHGFDIYDVATDCRHPQLLASTTQLTFSMDGGFTQKPLQGHEGWFAPDGLTFYVGDVTYSAIHAVDISDPTKPKILDTYQHPWLAQDPVNPGRQIGGTHGGSTSTDGNRIYPVSYQFPPPGQASPQTGPWYGGAAVVDTSDIQARKPFGKMKFISEAVVRDLTANQHTIPVTIAGNKYLIILGEAGGGGIDKAGMAAACAAGVIPSATAQLWSLADETKPQLINKTMLEAQDPKNCAQIQPDFAATSDAVPFLYDVHHCAVDNRDNATTLACGYFYSGIRVFDIRDPQHFKEIAYYVPPATGLGATNFFTSPAGSPKWCAAPAIVDVKTSSVYSWCADTGIVALKFTNGVWPFPESTTPPEGPF